MKRTVKIPLRLSHAESSLLLKTLKVAADAYNLLSVKAVQNKIISKQKLHTEYYQLLRQHYPELPSAYVQTLRDQLVESLKSVHSNHPTKKWTITPSKKQYSALRLDARTFTIRGQQLTISTTDSRLRTIINIPEWFLTRYPDYTATNSATLSYDKYKKRFFLNLTYTTTETPKPHKGRTEIIGLDRGIYNIVSTSTGEHYGSKEIRAQRREHMYLRKKLQQKGTRSAKRLLKKRSGKEKRFMLNENHKIVKNLMETNPDAKAFVLENLTGIRKQRKGKKMNTYLSQWSFFQLETLLTYKALSEGIKIIHIDPRYTSQACNQCGTINKNSRKRNKYRCDCGWTAHADTNAALNIKDIGTNHLNSRKLSRVQSITQTSQQMLDSSPAPRGWGH